jgi:hypothetical protein
MNYKKITLVPIIILLGILLAWFFAGLVIWINQNHDWFISLGPWGSSGGFTLSFVSIMMTIISFLGGVGLALWVAMEG